MDCNTLGSAGGGDLAQLAPEDGRGHGGAPAVDAVPGRAEVVARLRRQLEELEFTVAELEAELGCALEAAPTERLWEWALQLDWCARRLALSYVSDAPGY